MMYEKLKAYYQEVRRDKTAKVQQALLSTILGDLQKIWIDAFKALNGVRVFLSRVTLFITN